MHYSFLQKVKYGFQANQLVNTINDVFVSYPGTLPNNPLECQDPVGTRAVCLIGKTNQQSQISHPLPLETGCTGGG